MNKIKLGLLILSGLLLSACATESVILSRPAVVTDNEDATVAIAQTANSVDSSLLELARIQAVATPPVEMDLPEHDSASMPNRISVDWSGPIGPLVDKIAASSQYKLRVLGNPPAIPVLVSVTAHDALPGDVLRDLDYQAANKANIFIYPENRTVELRYAHQ